KQQGTATVFEELSYLFGVKSSVERNRRAARGDRSKIGCRPARVVVGEDRQPRTRLLTLFSKPASDGFGHAPQIGVGVTFEAVAALDFKREIERRDGLESYTYSDLRRMAESIAGWLREQGQQPGSRLAILADNHPRWTATYLGAIAAGCTAVPLDTAFHAEQVAKLLKDSGSSLLF